MITLHDIKEKYLNDKNANNKFLLKMGIIKITEFYQHSFNNEYWIGMRFNYWNPLTYFYLIIMSLLSLPSFIVDGGLKEMWRLMKIELTEGFGEWIK